MAASVEERFGWSAEDFVFVPKTSKKLFYSPDEPRDSNGRWGAGGSGHVLNFSWVPVDKPVVPAKGSEPTEGRD